MRRLLPLVLLVLIPAPSAALADGCPPATCLMTSSVSPGSRLLVVRPMGPRGSLTAIDLLTGARRFSLPNGLLSADGGTYASSAPVNAKRTTIGRYNARTGKLQAGLSLQGVWEVAGLTADGRRVALARHGRRETLIGVADRRLRIRKTLRGAFDVEALSPNGRRVFLVHWRKNGYRLEQLDLASNTLKPTLLDEPDEKMSGAPMTAVATRDGGWLLTLYLKADGSSFVHALNLRTGVAHCVDLPLKGDFVTVGSTALTLSPDERRLYLASPLLGRVTTVDLGRLRMIRTVRFRAIKSTPEPSPGPSGAVSANGRMLAFTEDNTVWLYDTAFGVLHRPMRTRSTISGIGFAPGGRQLLAIASTGRVLAVDAATGKRMR